MTSVEPQADPERSHPSALAEDVVLNLIAQGFETENLDYKDYFDPSDKGAVIEIVKDVAAMQSVGGHLFFGLNDSGEVTGSLDSVDSRLFDETSIRAKFEKYFDGFLSLSVRTLTVQDKKVVAVYMEPHPHGFAIIKSNVQKDGTTKYRAGDIFVRHGTASVRAQHDDIARLRESLVARKRAEWIRDVRPSNVDSRLLVENSGVASSPAETLGWHLDTEELSAIVVEQLRRSDEIPIRLLLQDSVWDIYEGLNRDNGKESVILLLDRMAALLTLFLRLGRGDLYGLGVESLHAVYMSPRDLSGNYRNEMRVDPPEFWLEIYKVIAIVGAVATKLGDWSALRLLVLQRVSFEDGETYTSWYRHSLVMASRANLLTEELEGRTSETAPLIASLKRAKELRSCSRVIAMADDDLLTMLCRFDFLAAFITLDSSGEKHQAFPAFARFFSKRTEPIVRRLVSDSVMRQELTRSDDRTVAEHLATLDRLATSQAFTLSGWGGFHDPHVREFLDENRGSTD